MGTTTVANNASQEQVQSQADSVFSSANSYVTAKGEKANVKEFSADLTTIFLASDLGGSKGRTFQLHRGVEPTEEDLIIVNSNYTILDDYADTSVIKSVSNNIEDNLELIIQENEGSPYIKNSWFDKPQHILKGSLLEMSNEVPMTINNQHDKTMDIGIFVNHLVNIAIASYRSKLTKVSIKTAITLPVKERYSSAERISLLCSYMAGSYTVKMPRLGYELEVTIAPNDIHVESEAETAFIYMMFTSNGNPDILKYADSDIVFNDVGKTTYNLVLISKGTAMPGKSHTGKFGGDNLQSSLYHYLSKTRTEAISFEQAGHALETGCLEIGSQVIPIGPELTAVKRDFAKNMMKEYTNFLQNSFMQSTQIYANVFLGRTMQHTGHINDDDTPSENFSPSLGELFIDQFKRLSGSTQGFILSTPGLATILGLTIMMRQHWKL